MGELTEGIVVKSKTIEDRLSGEIAECTGREVKVIEYDEHEDAGFTISRMKERGVDFI
jgi:hypothetical protein